jgi:hypothetical protein
MMKMIMKSLLTIVFAVVLCVSNAAIHDSLFVSGRITDKITGEDMSDARVELYDSERKLIQRFSCNDTGGVVLPGIAIGNKYYLHFVSKGYLMRYFVVDLTQTKNMKRHVGGVFLPMSMSLFPELPGIDYSELRELPTAILIIDPNLKDVDYDYNSIEVYREKSDPIIQLIREQLKIPEGGTLTEQEPEAMHAEESESGMHRVIEPNYTLEWMFGGIMLVSLSILALIFYLQRKNDQPEG